MNQGAAQLRACRRATGLRRLLSAASLATALSLAACTPLPPDPVHSRPAPATGSIAEVATGLLAPWSMVALTDGSVLVSERDTGDIVEVSALGVTRVVGNVLGVVPSGEGGLLGLAAGPGCPVVAAQSGACVDLFAYLTTATDNRIVRIPVYDAAGARRLGAATTILAGIPKAGNHNGGRLAFGPDGMLYATTGDAGRRNAAQDPASLAGKILRLTPDGGIPADNPFPGTPVWTLGHRNSQGIAWDSQGRMWASEFGQNTWDELNQITRGANYGWPFEEGIGADPRFTNPVLTWSPAEASPSGIAISGNTLYMAALRGQRLWVINVAGTPRADAPMLDELHQIGRLRDVTLTDDGRLLVLTNNTDGRGRPRDGDDRIVAVPLG